MNRTAITSITTAVLWLASELPAHGGQYRGPSSVVPPGSSSGGSGTTSGGGTGSTSSGGSPGGSSGSSSSGSSTGTSVNAPAAATAGPVPRGAALSADLTRWEFWWEFGKNPFLRLRDAVYGGDRIAPEDAWLNPKLAMRARSVQPPTTADRQRTAQLLVELLQVSSDRDTTSACLVALAKVGLDGPGWQLHEQVLPFLSVGDQEIRETAALALGIAGQVTEASVDTLCALLADDDTGRKLSGGGNVNERTRAFAAYGLGLLLQQARHAGLAHQIVDALTLVIAEHERHGREVQVAAIEALSLFPVAWDAAAAKVLRGGICDALTRYYDLPLGPGEQLIQAHVPTALGRLLATDSARAVSWRGRLARELRHTLDHPDALGQKVNLHIAQSAVLGLGALTPAWDDEDAEVGTVGELLLEVYRNHKDHQTRWFAARALGTIGGVHARDALLALFEDGNQALERPWIALALGVMQARRHNRARATHSVFEPDEELGERLAKALQRSRNPSARAALALALGLMRHEVAGDELRALLQDNSHQDDLAGYISIGLGLMRDPLAAGDVRQLMQRSTRRPQVVLHCAQALGLLGDHTVVDALCAELTTDRPSLVRLSAAASALGQIGDRRALQPLFDMLERDDITRLTRAFAVVALGSICDQAPLPWNTAYAAGCNYRASTSTLTDGAAGILDIL